METEVTKSGPVFDGRAKLDMEEGCAAIRRELASRGQQLVRAAFTAAIRDNHGRFLASITTTDRSGTYSTVSGRHVYSMPVVVDDLSETAVTTDLASYGPWLEGVGSRNDSTRFKGYHGFRLAGQQLDAEAEHLADGALAPYAERMS